MISITVDQKILRSDSSPISWSLPKVFSGSRGDSSSVRFGKHFYCLDRGALSSEIAEKRKRKKRGEKGEHNKNEQKLRHPRKDAIENKLREASF